MPAELYENQQIPLETLDKLRDLKGSKIGQDPLWLDLLSRSFDYPGYLLLQQSNDLQIENALLLAKVRPYLRSSALISLPFLNTSGLIKKSLQNDQLVDKLKEIMTTESLDYIQIRDDQAYEHPDLTISTEKVTFILELKDSEKLWDNFSAKVRNLIRKGIKPGFKYSIYSGQELNNQQVRDFYQIISRSWHEHGSPCFGIDFFQELVNTFNNQVYICFLHDKEKIIASGLVMEKNGHTEIIWAATLKSYKRTAANMLLYWKTIEYLAQQNFKTFDFGRCSKDSGTYQFKKQWGGKEVQQYWYYLYHDQHKQTLPKKSKFKILLTTIWKNLPYRLCTFLGPRIVKYLPV